MGREKINVNLNWILFIAHKFPYTTYLWPASDRDP